VHVTIKLPKSGPKRHMSAKINKAPSVKYSWRRARIQPVRIKPDISDGWREQYYCSAGNIQHAAVKGLKCRTTKTQ